MLPILGTQNYNSTKSANFTRKLYLLRRFILNHIYPAGITIEKLSEELLKSQLAMSNMGTIAKQTISGALSTGTHGSGSKIQDPLSFLLNNLY